MKTPLSTFAGLLVTGFVLSSSTAQAADCTVGWNKRAYNTGIPLGASIVAQAWDGIGQDCDRLEEFETIVINNLMDYVLPAYASDYTVCRYDGYIEGMLQAIDDLYMACGEECAIEGAMIGEISAIAYCQLSYAFGGLVDPDDFTRLPVMFCGQVFQTNCDLSFNTVTRAYVDDGWDDPLTQYVNEGACFLYTDEGIVLDETGAPMWEGVWNEVRNIQCAYELPTDKDDN